MQERECTKHLGTLGVVNAKHVQAILTAGVRASIQAMYNMKLARSAALEVLKNEQNDARAAKSVRKASQSKMKKKKKGALARTRKGAAGA